MLKVSNDDVYYEHADYLLAPLWRGTSYVIQPVYPLLQQWMWYVPSNFYFIFIVVDTELPTSITTAMGRANKEGNSRLQYWTTKAC